jgi:hypothetical protein
VSARSRGQVSDWYALATDARQFSFTCQGQGIYSYPLGASNTKKKKKKEKEKNLSIFNNFMRETATTQLEREKTTTQ